jgi:hypothetical protein
MGLQASVRHQCNKRATVRQWDRRGRNSQIRLALDPFQAAGPSSPAVAQKQETTYTVDSWPSRPFIIPNGNFGVFVSALDADGGMDERVVE